MAYVRGGPIEWSASRDAEGYRDYKVKHLVGAQGTDGPANVLRCPGLPRIGAPWIFGTDVDIWCWCRPERSVQLHDHRQGELLPQAGHDRFWVVESTFSNRPLKKCHEFSIENPILEPPKLSGSFVQYQEEATFDRFHRPILSSSWEQIRGPQVEFDRNRPTVEISMNVPIFSLPLVSSMLDTVNDAVLWGMWPRCIKLSRVSWERLYYGYCFIYYKLNLGFDVNYNSFDREVLDEGQKFIRGHWHPTLDRYVIDMVDSLPADPLNPAHFKRATDPDGNPIHVVLDGYGRPAATTCIYNSTGSNTFCTEIGNVVVQKYFESNFLRLGIPAKF